MYLLLFKKVSKEKLTWLTKYALPVSPLSWIHNATVEGTIPVTMVKGGVGMKSLRDEVDYSSTVFISYVESKIKNNSLRGITKQLVINKLNLITEASVNLEIIGYAKDLLCILGEDEETTSEPDHPEKEYPLGCDKKDVEDYLLRLAKKPSIH